MIEKKKVLGTFPVDLPVRFGWVHYNMYLTNKRIVFGKTGSGPADQHSSPSLVAKILTAFINSLGLIGLIRLVLQRNDKNRYDHMSSEEILRVDKNNFAWDYQNDIKSIELKEFGMPGIGKKPSKIVINPIHGKKKTFFFKKTFYAELKSLLGTLSAERLMIK